jgi:hypothetical protein
LKDTFKNIIIIQKDPKTIAIKRMRIKIKIKKFYFLLKGEIEKKNQFNKRTKKHLQESGLKLK